MAAAVSILRQRLPNLRIRVVHVIDLMKLLPRTEHPHGLSDTDVDLIFTKDKPTIFAFHVYPWLVHRLTVAPTRELVEREGVQSIVIPVSNDTRRNCDLDETTREQFRFVFPGVPLSDVEWHECLGSIARITPPPAFVIASQ